MSTIGQLRIWLGTKVNAVRKDCCYLFYSIFIRFFISTNTNLHFGTTDDIETVGGYNEAELEDMMNEDNNDDNWLCFFCFVKTDKSNSHLLNILSKPLVFCMPILHSESLVILKKVDNFKSLRIDFGAKNEDLTPFSEWNFSFLF